MRKADEIEQLALETLSKHQMVTPGQKILVGVSGGADSVALLHLLHKNRETLEIELAIGHVHHGIRGKEADDEADFVRQLAEDLQVPLYVTRENVPAEKKRLHLSTQEAARLVRHTFLRTTARQIGAERIAIAHTQTDRIETILLRILRGTGTAGLEGFPAVDLPLIRPLYAIRREETEAYCRQWKLRICEDSSNLSLAYRRNILRLELLPYLRDTFNVEIDTALLRLAEIAKQEADYLDGVTLNLIGEVVERKTPNLWTLNGVALRRQHRALQRRLVRHALLGVLGQTQNISFELLEYILEQVDKRQGGSITFKAFRNLAGYLTYEEGTDTLVVGQHLPEDIAPPWSVTLKAPGITLLPDGRQVEITLYAEKGTTRLSQNVEHRDIQQGNLSLPYATAFAIPNEAVQLPLVVREWRAGDKMSPRGMSGTKKLQDLFTDAKIRGRERSTYPLLVDEEGEGKVWAVFGLRLAEDVVSLEEEKRLQEMPNRIEIRIETKTLL